MAEEVQQIRWLPSLRTVVRACLALQIGVAVLIVADDTWHDLTYALGNEIETVPTPPVTPGDQTRPFVPVSVPGGVDPATRLGSPVRLPDTLPRRLEFRLDQTEGFGRVLLLLGEIAEGDGRRFESFLRDITPAPDHVALHSPGGLVDEALRIGRHVRGQGLATLVTADAACLSACPYILAGGVRRVVSQSGWVGLHQSYFGQESVLPAVLAVRGLQELQGETLEYLDDMGIDPLILVHALKTPPEDVYILVGSELTEHALATELVD
ncbi:MAG: hypothetical protein AAF409_16675 [Pseudomonadota bacterium]